MASKVGFEIIGYQAAQLGALLAAAPLLEGVRRKLRAFFAGQRGRPLLSAYSDLFALLGKESILSSEASAVAAAAPFVVFGATVAAAALLPVVITSSLAGSFGDVLALIGLLTLSRASLALAALDTGSPQGGRAASRDLTLFALAFPALVGSLLVLAFAVGTTALGPMAEVSVVGGPENLGLLASYTPARVLALGAFALVTFAELGRGPLLAEPGSGLAFEADGVFVEYSGRHLGLLSYASQVKQLLFYVLLGNLFLPGGIARTLALPDVALSSAVILLKVLVLTALYTKIETSVVRLRFFRLPELFTVATGAALLAAVAVAVEG